MPTIDFSNEIVLIPPPAFSPSSLRNDYNHPVGDFGKILIVIGALLVIFGALLVVGGRQHLPIGRLPGDIVYRGKSTTVYFPIVTSILLSVVLSLVLYLIGRFTR